MLIVATLPSNLILYL